MLPPGSRTTGLRPEVLSVVCAPSRNHSIPSLSLKISLRPRMAAVLSRSYKILGHRGEGYPTRPYSFSIGTSSFRRCSLAAEAARAMLYFWKRALELRGITDAFPLFSPLVGYLDQLGAFLRGPSAAKHSSPLGFCPKEPREPLDSFL